MLPYSSKCFSPPQSVKQFQLIVVAGYLPCINTDCSVWPGVYGEEGTLRSHDPLGGKVSFAAWPFTTVGAKPLYPMKGLADQAV